MSLPTGNATNEYYFTLLNCIHATVLINDTEKLDKFLVNKDKELLDEENENKKYKHCLREITVSLTCSEDALQVRYLINHNYKSNDPSETVTKKQIIVAFRGARSFNDFLIDVQLNGRLSKCQGRFHSGVFSRSQSIQIEYFVKKIVEEDYEVVFTGHSLGAAVGALVALRVLLHDGIYGDEAKKSKVLFIGFGTPPLADNSFKEFIQGQYKENFHFYINEDDVIVTTLDVLTNVMYEYKEFQKSDEIKKLSTVFISLSVPEAFEIKYSELVEFLKKENPLCMQLIEKIIVNSENYIIGMSTNIELVEKFKAVKRSLDEPKDTKKSLTQIRSLFDITNHILNNTEIRREEIHGIYKSYGRKYTDVVKWIRERKEYSKYKNKRVIGQDDFIEYGELKRVVALLRDKSEEQSYFTKFMAEKKSSVQTDNHKMSVELINVTSTVFRSMVPNFSHFGEITQLIDTFVNRRLPLKTDLMHLMVNSKNGFKTEGHMPKNYLGKIVKIIERERSSKADSFPKVYLDKQLHSTQQQNNTSNPFNLPLVLPAQFKLARTELKTDLFIQISCENSEYILNGSILIGETEYFVKRIRREHRAVQLIISIPNGSLEKPDRASIVLKLTTHFQKVEYEIKDLNLNVDIGFSQKEISIEDLPVDLLYIYAINYIIMFRNCKEFEKTCKQLTLHLKEICELWEIDSKKKHGFSDDELNGVLFSYFTKEDPEYKEQTFNTNLVLFTEYLCEKNLEKLVENVLPTCYHLKEKQSTFASLDSLRAYYLSLYSSFKNKSAFKKAVCDNGYHDKLKLFKDVQFDDVLPYAGFYEQAVCDNKLKKKCTPTRELETVRLNREIRDILKKGYIFGLVGKRDSCKQAFLQKLIPEIIPNDAELTETPKTGLYSTSDLHILIDYAYFDSNDFSQKLEFIFSRKLLNFVFLISATTEELNRDIIDQLKSKYALYFKEFSDELDDNARTYVERTTGKKKQNNNIKQEQLTLNFENPKKNVDMSIDKLYKIFREIKQIDVKAKAFL